MVHNTVQHSGQDKINIRICGLISVEKPSGVLDSPATAPALVCLLFPTQLASVFADYFIHFNLSQVSRLERSAARRQLLGLFMAVKHGVAARRCAVNLLGPFTSP